MIPKLVEKFKGREDAYYTALVKKYGPLGQQQQSTAKLRDVPSPPKSLDNHKKTKTNDSSTMPSNSLPGSRTVEDEVTLGRNDWMSIFGCFGCGGSFDADMQPVEAPREHNQISSSTNHDSATNALKLQRLEQQLVEARQGAERLAQKTAEFERKLTEAMTREEKALSVAKEAADEVEKLKEANVMRDVEIAGLFQARAESEGVLEKVIDDVKHLRERLHANDHHDIESTLAATETSMRALEVQLGGISKAVEHRTSQQGTE